MLQRPHRPAGKDYGHDQDHRRGCRAHHVDELHVRVPFDRRDVLMDERVQKAHQQQADADGDHVADRPLGQVRRPPPCCRRQQEVGDGGNDEVLQVEKENSIGKNDVH